jgi:hypothetical protein
MKKVIILTIVISYTLLSYAQRTGYVNGTITDGAGEVVAGTHVDILYASGAISGQGTVSDIDGHYTIVNLHPGSYDLMYSSPHKASVIVNGVLVGADEATGINILLRSSAGKEYKVVSYEKPLINEQDTRLDQRVSQKDINNQNVNDIAGQQAGVEQRDAGSRITIEGSHEYEVLYMLNGIPLMNNNTAFFGHGRP